MAGVSNRRVAEAANCSECWVSQVLRGKAKPGPKLRTAVSRILGLPEDLLFHAELQGPVK
jgi:transcriptional regulator with XRE-family HTH domain